MSNNQPMNLYFPSSCLEQAERDLSYEYHTEEKGVSRKLVNYLQGIDAIDHHAYAWIIGLWNVNDLGYHMSVPAWVYIHQRNPNAHDRRWFDGTENQQDEQGNNPCTSWEEEDEYWDEKWTKRLAGDDD